MKLVFLLIFIFPSFIFSFAQKEQAVFFELAGSGGFGSINFEKQFHKKNNRTLTWRAGFSVAPIDRNNGFGLVFPLMINALVGRHAHKLELGLGQGITVTIKGSGFILATAAIGYRYQPETKNWFCRITYTPLISYLVDLQVQQWAGISIGRTFNKKEK